MVGGNVWLCIPSARPGGGTAAKWKKAGYKVALWRDVPDECGDLDFLTVGPYPGYAVAVNRLVDVVLSIDSSAEWIVTGGDDTLPDPRPPAEIAAECTEHFGGTFGVMQPTGDRWAGGQIDRICGSPWMGREFCRRIYGGRGPLWHEFTHMHVDEHLFNVALKLGILWQRRDLTHLHNHFTRENDAVDWNKGRERMPDFLREANSKAHWARSSAIFQRLKDGGFAEANDLLP